MKDNCAVFEEMSGFGVGTNAALNGTRSKPEVGGGGWDGKGRLEQKPGVTLAGVGPTSEEIARDCDVALSTTVA